MRRLLPIIVAAIIFSIVILAASGIWLYSELETPYYGTRTAETFVDIPRGATTAEMADLLVDSGILRARMPFKIYLRFADMGRRIQAGEYRFSQAATPKQIAQRLVRGDVYFRSITVPEGLTADETIELLAKNGIGNRAELERAMLQTDWIRDLDPAALNLEGYLFPETYRFRRKTDSEAAITAMVQQFRVRLAQIQALYPAGAGWSVSRIVILASMVEKEVKKPEEGPIVASVLVNRLEKGMPLGCDATIIYAMKLAGTYEGRLSRADLEMESPYNTYLHLNLPPGPISNPGASSLRAALNPAKSDYLYYVSRNDGTHQFSKDFRSHQHAVDRFQKPLARRASRR